MTQKDASSLNSLTLDERERAVALRALEVFSDMMARRRFRAGAEMDDSTAGEAQADQETADRIARRLREAVLQGSQESEDDAPSR